MEDEEGKEEEQVESEGMEYEEGEGGGAERA